MRPESFRERVTAVKHGWKRKDAADERRGNDPDSTNEQEASEEEQQRFQESGAAATEKEANLQSLIPQSVCIVSDSQEGTIFAILIKIIKKKFCFKHFECTHQVLASSSTNNLQPPPPPRAHPSGITGTQMPCNNPPMAVFFFASRFIKNNCAESQVDDQLAFSTDVPKKINKWQQ